MAEDSIRIADATSGDRIATRDAAELDGGANARVIERVDFASGKGPTPLGNATRGNAAAISAAETFTIASFPADLTGNLITVGDKSMLVVTVQQSVSGGTATITPVIYDNEGSPGVCGLLPPKTFTEPYAFTNGSYYHCPAQAWDCHGAYKIGLHLSAITGTSNTVKIWGWVI